MVKIEDQVAFYSEELKELEFSIKKTFNATALSLFQAGELYIGQFKGVDQKRGNVFIDIPNGEGYHSPRLDQKMTCFTLKSGQERPTLWGDLTFSDLLNNRNRVETKIVDYMPSKREGWITMLIRDMDVDFLEKLENNQILAFGPTIPPFEYLQNLKEFSQHISKDPSSHWAKMLLFDYPSQLDRQPELITEEKDIPQDIINKLNSGDILLFQGPPGTGKTHQIADLVSRLVRSGQSVLIAALTNKAAIEVCEKPFLNNLFEEGRVSKLPLSLDERKRYPKLIDAKDLIPIKGHLHLTTYYQFSRTWLKLDKAYDYIIIEEASQAYLTTIAGAAKVGKKVIVVGDPKQIIPIVTNKNYRRFENIESLIHGMNTLSKVPNFAFLRKVESRRLTERSVSFTNSFYDNTVKSKSLHSDLSSGSSKLDVLATLIHNNGGPTLIEFSKSSQSVIQDMLAFLVLSIDELQTIKNIDIAVLTPHVESLTHLQKHLKSKTKSRNYLIETVDRVQGLDVDYCFYVIPRSSSFSFNVNRFNVATSRAKRSTFILVTDDFDKVVNLSAEVGQYLSRLKREFCFNARDLRNPHIVAEKQVKEEIELEDVLGTEAKIPGVKVVGKIDVSKFERKAKEIDQTKRNLYVIDTNVFIDYPEVIEKVNKEHGIILSAKVLDELDKLKSTLDSDGQRKVQKALRSINHQIDKREIKLEMANLELLPKDFNPRSPDNFILSVLLKFPNDNPILLTSDHGLQIKAKGMGILTVTLKDFLRRR
jgi:DNA replication ATP-dependent helicase Dna2